MFCVFKAGTCSLFRILTMLLYSLGPLKDKVLSRAFRRDPGILKYSESRRELRFISRLMPKRLTILQGAVPRYILCIEAKQFFAIIL